MKRLVMLLLLLAVVSSIEAAYKLDISTTYNENNTATAPTRQRVFVRFHDDTILNYTAINSGLTAAFDTSIAVDSLGTHYVRVVSITSEGDSLLSGQWISSYYGTLSVAVASIAANAITATSIAADAIGESELAANSITSSEVADNAIDAGAIAANAVGASEIADNAIDAGAIAADAIGSSEIATDAIGAAEIAAGAIVAGTEATGFSAFNPSTTGVFLTAGGTESDTSFSNLQTTLTSIKAKTDKLIFGADDSLIIDYGNIPSVSLTSDDIDDIIAGILDAGIQIDTAAFRASLAATPMIVGTNNDKTGYSLFAVQSFSTTGFVGGVTGNVSGNIEGTLASLAAAAQHQVALASDSGNVPVATIDYDLAAQIIYDYFVEDSREDPFKGGAGAGPDSTVIVVLSESDSLPIVGASVSYYVGADKLATRTNADGEAEFGATTGSWSAVVEAKPRYAGVATITAGTRDTIFMTTPTIAEPDEDSLTQVYGYIYGLNGDPIQGAIIKAKNQGQNIRVGSTVVSQYEVVDTTDAGGYWSIPLYPTATLGGTNYRYTFSLTKGTLQSIVVKNNITVPDTSSWQFTW